ncbi:phosphopantothenoylcysteine decarboxylase [Isosphaeraceae bacterium EP7]
MTDAGRAVEGSPVAPAGQGPEPRASSTWNVVVTGGGTVAAIDEVRQIANRSTGRMAASIAEACLGRGASVWHVAAPGSQLAFERRAQLDLDAADPAVEFRRLERLRAEWLAVRDRYHPVRLKRGTVDDYARRLEETLKERPVDIVFLAMAVSDFEPEPAEGKIRSEADSLVIRCRPTAKVIRKVRDWAPDAYIVGFKLLAGATTAELVEEARRALVVNRADLTVANDQRTVTEGRHTIHLVREGGPVETYAMPEPIAERLVERSLEWSAKRKRG